MKEKMVRIQFIEGLNNPFDKGSPLNENKRYLISGLMLYSVAKKIIDSGRYEDAEIVEDSVGK